MFQAHESWIEEMKRSFITLNEIQWKSNIFLDTLLTKKVVS